MAKIFLPSNRKLYAIVDFHDHVSSIGLHYFFCFCFLASLFYYKQYSQDTAKNTRADVLVGMCLKENYSDSPSNEYSLHYSAESEYLRRQNMNSKLGEEQKRKKKRSSRPYKS